MERHRVEKFKKEDRPVWGFGRWSAMPVQAKIVNISDDGPEGGSVELNYMHTGACRITRRVHFDDLYETKEDMIKTMYETVLQKTAEIKVSVQTKEDCIQFLFMHNVSCTEAPDWTARRAIQEIARERWNMDLE